MDPAGLSKAIGGPCPLDSPPVASTVVDVGAGAEAASALALAGAGGRGARPSMHDRPVSAGAGPECMETDATRGGGGAVDGGRPDVVPGQSAPTEVI